jgi:acetyltransferase-like isoleucine patch superfamily enzyme
MWEKEIKETMQRVTQEIISRCIRYSRRCHREIFISKTSSGKGVNVKEFDFTTPKGRAAMEAFLKVPRRHYTIYGLGAPSERNAVNWRNVNLGRARRTTNLLLIFLAMMLKGTPFKIRLYRLLGVHIGQDTEIMMGAWLDQFRPELIFIGDRTLIGAFTRITVHAYEGLGKFRYGVVSIGSDCKIASGTGMGVIQIGDRVRTLPNTVLSPYYIKIPDGAIVGYQKPACATGGPEPGRELET